MKLKDILKPKTPKQITKDFADRCKISVYELELFLKLHKKDKRIITWVLSIFTWIFALSLIISGIIALVNDFFWFPFELGNNMLTSFINIFWSISWFAIAIFMIIYMINVLYELWNN